jgi:Tol biopolymer transport system component
MKNARYLLTALLCLMVISVSAQERSMTLEDLFSYKRIGGPALSPDGKWVAFTINIPNLEENRSRTDIWIIDANGGKPWQLTNGTSSSYGQVWAPDSKHIAFLRAGQPWLISIDGGEAKQIAEVSNGASGLKWSPDGKKLLFTSFVCPTCGEECKCGSERPANKQHVTAKVADDLLYRHWDTWRTDGKRSHLFILDVESGEYTNLTAGGDYDVPPSPLAAAAITASDPTELK